MESKRQKEHDWEEMHRDIAINGRQQPNIANEFNEFAADADV